MLGKIITSYFLLLGVLGDSSSDTSMEANFDWTLPVLLGLGLIFINTALANAAGIGGGPITVCILMNIMNFDSMRALALCQVAIFGGSLVATIIKTTYKHPYNKEVPLIDYDLVAYLSGLLIAGSSAGTLITRIAQPWMSLAGLIVLVWYISISTFIKGRELYRKETLQNSSVKSLALPLVNKTQPQSQLTSIVFIIVSLIMVLLYSFVKGDQKFSSIVGIQHCSAQYFGVMIGYFFLVLAITMLISMYLVSRTKKNSEYSESFRFTSTNMIHLPVMTFITGIISGSLGIGGALMLNPLLSLYGILPEVSAACCNVFVVLTSLSSLLQYYMAGLISYEEALVLFSVSLPASVLGTLGVKKLVNMYKRASILVFLLAGMLGLVGLVLPIDFIMELSSETERNIFSFELRSVC